MMLKRLRRLTCAVLVSATFGVSGCVGTPPFSFGPEILVYPVADFLAWAARAESKAPTTTPPAAVPSPGPEDDDAPPENGGF